MKDSSLEFLNNAISQIAINDRNDVLELFKFYTAIEIDSYDLIIDSTNDFFDTLKILLPYNEKPNIKCAIDSAFKIVYFDISRLSRNSYEMTFARNVLDLSPTPPANAHILDVGSGKMPISSLVLGLDSKMVSSMDSSFFFSSESLKHLNVNAIESYFQDDTPVSEYDFVVGRYPCSAIEHMVSNCTSQNKPYFIELCNCWIPDKLEPLIHDIDDFSWEEYLPEIDPHIQFYDGYAFNLGASTEQVKRVLEKNEEARIMPDRYNIKPKKLYVDLSNVSFFSTSTPTQTSESELASEELSSFDWD